MFSHCFRVQSLLEAMFTVRRVELSDMEAAISEEIRERWEKTYRSAVAYLCYKYAERSVE